MIKIVKKDIILNMEIKVSVEEEVELYMLRDRVEDSVLNKAIEIIKENRVAGRNDRIFNGSKQGKKNDKENKIDKKKKMIDLCILLSS